MDKPFDISAFIERIERFTLGVLSYPKIAHPLTPKLYLSALESNLKSRLKATDAHFNNNS